MDFLVDILFARLPNAFFFILTIFAASGDLSLVSHHASSHSISIPCGVSHAKATLYHKT